MKYLLLPRCIWRIPELMKYFHFASSNISQNEAFEIIGNQSSSTFLNLVSDSIYFSVLLSEVNKRKNMYDWQFRRRNNKNMKRSSDDVSHLYFFAWRNVSNSSYRSTNLWVSALSQPSSVDTSYSIVAEAEKKLLDLKEHTTKIVSSIIVKLEKLCRLELERGRHQSF